MLSLLDRVVLQSLRLLRQHFRLRTCYIKGQEWRLIQHYREGICWSGWGWRSGEIMRPDLRPADQSLCDVARHNRPAISADFVVGVDKMARRLREAKVLLGLQSWDV